MTGFDQPPFAGVKARAGLRHPSLGEIGGWEGVVMRQFAVGGVVYFDVEVSPATIAGLSAQRREEYYRRKIVFTRMRLRRQEMESLPTSGLPEKREAALASAQREWFREVGAREGDPTAEIVNRAGGGTVKIGRRQAIASLVGLGLFVVLMISTMTRDCTSNNSGSWGRSGGYSS